MPPASAHAALEISLARVTWVGLAITLPWLNPFAPGPSPGVVPWLVALVCVAGLRAGLPLTRAPRGWVLAAWALAVVVWLNSVAGAGQNLLTVAALVTFLVGAAVGRQAAHQEGLLKLVMAAWLVAGGLSGLLALVQYSGFSGALAPWVNGTPAGEAFANLRQRNQFATLTSIALVALCVVVGQGWQVAPPQQAAQGPQAGGQPAWGRWGLPMGLAVMLAVGNATSASRTGLAQWALVGLLFAVWGLWRQPVVRGVWLFAAAAYALAVWALPLTLGEAAGSRGLLARLAGEVAGCSSRAVLWSNVWDLVTLRPWWGWGWGGLDRAHYLTLFSGQRFCDILDNAHNLPLHLAVELGLPVAAAVCGAFAWAAWRQRPWRASTPARQLGWGVMAVIGLHSLLEYPLWYGPFALAFGVAVGLVWAGPAPGMVGPATGTPGGPGGATAALGAGQKEALSTFFDRPTPKLKSNRRLALVKSAATALFLMAMVVWVGWDYWLVSQVYKAPAERHPAYQTDALAKARTTWWFRDPVDFAVLTLTPLTRANAAEVAALADRLLTYSPEARVIEKRIEAAALLGDDDVAVRHLARYRAAFPDAYAQWTRGNRVLPGLLPGLLPEQHPNGPPEQSPDQASEQPPPFQGPAPR